MVTLFTDMQKKLKINEKVGWGVKNKLIFDPLILRWFLDVQMKI